MYRGGQIVHYKRNHPWHYRWKPLRSHNMDCGPNCFSVLKYATREVCEEMARRTRDGIRPQDILHILDQAYRPGHEWRIISPNGYNDQYVFEGDEENYDVTYHFIHTCLEINEATFASIAFALGDNLHYIVILRDEEGFHAIDAQTGKTMRLKDYMDDFIKEFPDSILSIVVSPLHHREAYKVSMKQIKEYFQTPSEYRQSEKKEQDKWRQTQKMEEKSRRNKERTLRRSEAVSMKMANAESRAFRSTSKSKRQTQKSQSQSQKNN